MLSNLATSRGWLPACDTPSLETRELSTRTRAIRRLSASLASITLVSVPLVLLLSLMSVVAWSQDPQRRSRLDSNIQWLYHGTDPHCARSILLSKQMHLGPYGWGGPGIYFAISATSACNMSRRHGALLEVQVRLGKTKAINPPKWGINFEQLVQEGYDSVTYQERGNDLKVETVYAVYNPDQIISIREISWVGPVNPARLPR